MSGDVQPRKRKDKKKKKDDVGVEEPRGTAAALGEGDLFLHSHQDHDTGGHWCAKIIFFSLLAVLITLIGLIILENRGLSELEANSVESRYSGVLEGWLEDAADDDHHDAHTLELKHHDDDDDDDHSDVYGHHHIDHDDDEDDEHDDLDDHDEDEEHDDDDHDDEEENADDDDHDDEEENADDDDHDEDEQDDEGQDENDTNDDEEENDQSVDAADNKEEDVGSFRKFFGFGYGDNKDDNDEEEEHTEAESLNDNENENDDGDDNDNDDDERTEAESLNDDENENDDGDDNDDEDDERTEAKAFYDNKDEIDDDEDEDNLSNENKKEDDNDDAEENHDFDDDEQNAEGDLSKENENENQNSFENFDDDDDDNTHNDYYEKDEDDDHDDHDDDDDDEEDNVEVERIEREVSEEDPISLELPALPEDDDDDDKHQDKDEDEDEKQGDDDDNDADDGDKDDDFLEADDDDEPPIERITAPSGRPFDEVEDDDVSTEKPPDTLEEEEEYEKKQEELRREQEEQSSHMWLKLVVGVALLAATHAVVRRATASPDETESDEHVTREETPVIDRRMTLIPVPEEPSEPEITKKASKPVLQKIVKKASPVVKTAPPPKEESEEEEDHEVEEIEMEEQENDDEKELFSEEEPEDEPEEENEIVQARKETPKQAVPTVHEHEPTPDDDVGDDVEIIDDEEMEEEDEEEISDVDDDELLTRLEAKYGRLPEPERPGPKHKDGGNSLADEWPGEPSDPFWRQQLDSAERNLRQGEYSAAARLAGAPQLAASGRARWILARALDTEAEARRDNNVLTRAIAAYIHLLKLNERLSDKKLLEITNRTLERIKFRGNYLSAEPVYRLLIRRFPDDVTYRNKLTVSYLMANRPDLANQTLKETLRLWPNDRVALAHYGFVLKTENNKLEEAVVAFQKALEGDQGPACEPRFYYHYGDALLLLGRFAEAHEVHKRGAKYGHFLSPAQRSLYNVPRLTGKPWWNVEETPYMKLARALEKSWREILKEGLAAQALYEKEKEGLKERGEWSQLDLFVRGREVPGRCARAPVTCSIVRAEAAAAGCRRGQVKFSAMAAGTHVRPHVGPTNCRLRMHLGLSNTKDTYLRVDQETRQWQEGKVLLFDDSFEHEVWHNGTGRRLVLIVDAWHPELTPAERRHLPAI